MNKYKSFFLALIVNILLLSCNSSENDQNIEESDDTFKSSVEINDFKNNDKYQYKTKKESTFDFTPIIKSNNLKAIFQYSEDTSLTYVGPIEIEEWWNIHSIEDTDDIFTFNISYAGMYRDLSGRSFDSNENNISNHIVQITKNEIAFNDVIILKAPLKIGNEWKSPWSPLFIDDNPSGEAKIKIDYIKNDIVSIMVEVQDERYRFGKFIGRYIFKIGYGIIACEFNTVNDIDLSSFHGGMVLQNYSNIVLLPGMESVEAMDIYMEGVQFDIQ